MDTHREEYLAVLAKLNSPDFVQLTEGDRSIIAEQDRRDMDFDNWTSYALCNPDIPVHD